MRFFSLFLGLQCSIFAMESNKNSWEQIFQKMGIAYEKREQHKIPLWKINPFKEPALNRNHWDSRNDVQIEYLVMHYTACDFGATFDILTADKKEGRVSAHYVNSEPEKGIIQGGQCFSLVPEEETAWHAGVRACHQFSQMIEDTR